MEISRRAFHVSIVWGGCAVALVVLAIVLVVETVGVLLPGWGRERRWSVTKSAPRWF